MIFNYGRLQMIPFLSFIIMNWNFYYYKTSRLNFVWHMAVMCIVILYWWPAKKVAQKGETIGGNKPLLKHARHILGLSTVTGLAELFVMLEQHLRPCMANKQTTEYNGNSIVDTRLCFVCLFVCPYTMPTLPPWIQKWCGLETFDQSK